MFDENRFREILREEIARALAVPSTTAPDHMTPREAATYCRCTTATLRNWQKRGLPAQKHGRVVRFQRLELDAWLATGKQQQVPERNSFERFMR